MINRKQKIKELMAAFQPLRRHMTLRSSGLENPRITPSQWGLLMLVEEQPGCTVKDAAKALGITSSAATQLVDGLVESGYVSRRASSADRRTVRLTLSRKSKERVAAMKKEALQKFLAFFEALNDKEFTQYLNLNKKIVEALRTKK